MRYRVPESTGLTRTSRAGGGAELARLMLCVMLLFLAGATPADAPVDGSAATRVVHELHEGLRALDLAVADPRTHLDAIGALIDRTHDMQYIARIVLGAGARRITEEQRIQFHQAFRDLSVANYASRLSGLAGNPLEIGEEREAAFGQRQVDAVLTTDAGKQIHFTYLLRRAGDDWRIVNVLADGVSDLALRRAEYAGLLREDGFESVATTIATQTSELLDKMTDNTRN